MADMIAAIAADRPRRCNADLALHVVDVMTACIRSGETGEFVTLETRCERPNALGAEAARALLADVR